MQTLYKAFRYALPVLFLGYAAYANYEILADESVDFASIDGDVIDGEAASQLGGLYAGALPHRSASVGLIGAARYELLSEGRDGVRVGNGGWLFTDEETDVASPDQMDAALDTITEVRDRLEKRGAKLVMIPVPAKLDIYRDHGGRPGVSKAMETQYHTFLSRLEKAGIPAVDTRPALEKEAEDAPVFLTTDTHWTPEGAKAVAARVAASGLIDHGSAEFERHADRPETFMGDLVSFVTTDELAPWVGIGPERVTPYVAEPAGGAGGGSIFAGGGEDGGDDAPDAVLVGTSYSANTNWSFVPALKLALDRDILNLAEEGEGPVAPMRAMLADPAYEKAAPSTVIWEYPVRYLADPGTLEPDEDKNLSAGGEKTGGPING